MKLFFVIYLNGLIYVPLSSDYGEKKTLDEKVHALKCTFAYDNKRKIKYCSGKQR